VAEAHPSVVVLSGPNGAGKSTMASRLLVGSLRVSEYVDGDAFAPICRVRRLRPPPPAVPCSVDSMSSGLVGGASALKRPLQVDPSARESAL
jgi:hypothetical protein